MQDASELSVCYYLFKATQKEGEKKVVQAPDLAAGCVIDILKVKIQFIATSVLIYGAISWCAPRLPLKMVRSSPQPLLPRS